MTELVPRVPVRAVPGLVRRLGREPIETFSDLVADTGLTRIAFAGTETLVVASADDVERIFFTDQDTWQKGSEYDIPALGLREGLVTSRGERWRRDRTLLNPLFSKRNLAPLGDVMADCAARRAGRWRPGERIDALAEMSRIALDIATRTLFGDVLSERDSQTVGDGLDEILREMLAVGQSPLVWALQGAPGPTLRLAGRAHWRTRRIDRRVAELDAIMERIVERRLADRDAPRDDFLAQLLAARDPATSAPFTRREILEQSATFLLAGHETTATGLTWTWHLLSRNPDARDRLHAELDAVLDGRPPTLADLAGLPWLRACFAEALRIHPPVYLSMRRATRDATLGEHRVRRGTIAIVLTHLVHRHPGLWPDPLRFDPERFLERGKPPRSAYAPFGGGKRVCIGTSFATMEAGLVLATIAQRFRLDAVPDWTVREEATTTLRPRGGLPLRVVDRAPAATPSRAADP